MFSVSIQAYGNVSKNMINRPKKIPNKKRAFRKFSALRNRNWIRWMLNGFDITVNTVYYNLFSLQDLLTPKKCYKNTTHQTLTNRIFPSFFPVTNIYSQPTKIYLFVVTININIHHQSFICISLLYVALFLSWYLNLKLKQKIHHSTINRNWVLAILNRFHCKCVKNLYFEFTKKKKNKLTKLYRSFN